MCQLFLFSLRKAVTFVCMKRIYSLIICLLVGISFLVLLYLQGSYATAMVKMREEQFDENVNRSIDQASRDLERSETYRYLQTVMDHHEQEKGESLKFRPRDSVSASLILDTIAAKYGSGMQQVGRRAGQLPNS